MRQIREIFFRLQPLFQRRQIEAGMSEEIQTHLDMATEANIAAGMSADEARCAALREFGGVEQIKECYRDERGIRWLEDLVRDFGYAFRSLRKTPAFTAVVVLSIALGIGANTAVFSVINAVLLRPLPYHEPDRLVRVHMLRADGRGWSAPNGDFFDWREQNTVFQDIAAILTTMFTITGGSEEAERVPGARVGANYFTLLGVKPLLGRTFVPEEDKQPGVPVAILSHDLWQRRFGADPSVLGKRLIIGGVSCDIIGVMPPRFVPKAFRPSADLWMPGPFKDAPPNERSLFMLQTIARLKPGISIERAAADMTAINDRIDRDYRKGAGAYKVAVKPLLDNLVEANRRFLTMLLGAVSLVLLIASANVANLLLARSAARQKEIAIRCALGASRRRIIQQFITEALLLAAIGGVAGTLLAFWSIEGMRRIIPEGTPRADEIGIDPRVLAFTALVTVLTGLLVGVAPAMMSSRPELNRSLNEGGRGTLAPAGSRILRHGLVVGEIAMALVLLIAAGLMINSLARLLAIDLGIQSENVLTVRLWLPAAKYSMPAGDSVVPGRKALTVRREKMLFIEHVLERIRGLPGVQSAAVTSILPLITPPSRKIVIEGQRQLPNAPDRFATSVSVTADYFKTVGMRLRQGRDFTEHDREGAPGVAIVSEKMARDYWPNQDPIGQRIRQTFHNAGIEEDRVYEIVGVVADAKVSVDGSSSTMMFIPIDQQGKRFTDLYGNQTLWLNFVARTAGDPTTIAAAVRGAIKEADSSLPISEVATMRQLISRQLSSRSFAMVLLSIFAAVALLLSAVGIFGVMSYSVAQRTHEIGVRMALGAARRDVLELVIRQGMRFAGIGVALGLAGALAATRTLSNLLFEITPTDPATAVAVISLLGVVTFFACYLPARRATKVDPMVALRCE